MQEQEPQDFHYNIRASDKDRTAITNSLLTLATEYSIDIPIFAVLYYKDNRQRYIDKITGKKNLSIIKADIKKLIAAFSISEIMYDVIKVSSQFQLLQQTNIEPFQAAMISSLLAWTAFFILINISMKVFSLFERKEFLWYCGLILSITITNSFIFFSNLETRVFYTNITVGITSGVALLSVLLLICKQRNLKVQFNKAFISLAVGLFLWFIAEVLWGYYQIGLKIDVPFPSSADALWLIGYPFLIVHLYYILNLLKKTKKKIDTIKVSHIVLMSLALAAVFGYTLGIVFGINFNNTLLLFNQKEVLGNIISIAYPVLDALLIVPAGAILWDLRRAGPQFTHWMLLSFFIVLVTAGDIGFGYSNILGEEIAEEQAWIWDVFYNAGYISIAAALFWYSKFAISTKAG
ncbi:MAG: hypothetical protein ACR2IS_10755 [Nitrososphaeraceae archaeon]